MTYIVILKAATAAFLGSSLLTTQSRTRLESEVAAVVGADGRHARRVRAVGARHEAQRRHAVLHVNIAQPAHCAPAALHPNTT